MPSMQELLEAGVHFGHQVRRWNPKMNQYIFSAREGIHIIDLAKTVAKLQESVDFVKKIAEDGGVILFLASKKQARAIVEEEAKRVGAKYVTERWIGGLLTNFEQSTRNIKKLADLKAKKESGEFKERTKKENLMIDRDIAKLERLYGGVWDMEKLPDVLFVIDVKKEENACREAKNKGIPVVAICDTNANLSLVDYAIPGNDDATRAIAIQVKAIADAYAEGHEVYEKKAAKEKLAADARAKKEEEEKAVAAAKAAEEEAKAAEAVLAARKAAQAPQETKE
ncbi:30S ribosomal protein S2 [Candidatus Curtissbacteria bacterium]|nr:30S ribosomal protein S2 [Candidatus Curtissbacteria bacterium]